ncbi:hypothetical protein [Streptosporangium sandarakinum]|uniref:hypothetical protein n=1 Tax=Streptosporangium sandarakinum TaxID=1260955 RepID=UPI0036CB4A34
MSRPDQAARRRVITAALAARMARARSQGASMAATPHPDGRTRTKSCDHAAVSAPPSAATGAQPLLHRATAVPVTTPTAAAVARDLTNRPIRATITREIITIVMSVMTAAARPMSTPAGPKRQPYTGSDIRATRLTAGAGPAKASASSAAAIRPGVAGSMEKYSGRRASLPPPMKMGPKIQPDSQTASVTGRWTGQRTATAIVAKARISPSETPV